MWSLFYSFLFLLLNIQAIVGQFQHIVQVGGPGSFYLPPTISAQVNDTVTFQFVGLAHTVTQSTFDAPCTPLRGGFNSGLAGMNSSGLVPSWSLVITNDSAPIFFFCEAVQPASHCSQGMVGIINPPSIDMYNQFVSAAKLVSGTPAPTPTVILTGQGAFATNSPVPTTSLIPTSSISSSISSETSSTTSSTPTPTPTPTSSSGSSSSHRTGAIIGGTIGGLLGLAIFLSLVYLWVRHERNKADANSFFRYAAPPTTKRMSMFQNTRSGVLPAPSSSGSSTMLSGRSPPVSSAVTTATDPVSILSPVRRQPSRDHVFGYSAGTSTSHGPHPFADLKALNPGYLSHQDSYPATPASQTAMPRQAANSNQTQHFPAPPPLVLPEKYEEQERQENGNGQQQQEQQNLRVDGGGTVNLDTLAREVAAVLMRDGNEGGDSHLHGDETPAPPPHYRSGP